ncbi:MAG: hypothetical protein OEU54_04405 [Gemmatimonadota bacterium]|nr:hypothetical protein [Gemmatimonadota bacterium]
MTKRGWWAVAILAVWATTMGFHVKRLYFRPVSELLIEAARTIPPGTAYYAVFQGERHIGWAQTDVDTLPSNTGFLLEDQLILREPLIPGMDPMRFTVGATLGPTFTLQSFQVTAEGIPGIRQVQGEVQGDSMLTIQMRGSGETRSETIHLDSPIVVAAAWPLRFAAARELETGDQFELPVYDPLTGSHRSMQLTVLEQRIRTFPDSVTAEDGRWITAREDTVTAWRVEHDVSGIKLEAWVDEDGRLLEAAAVGGIRLVRTAFEFAYFGEFVPDQISLPRQRPQDSKMESGGEGDGRRGPESENKEVGGPGT